jgi:hypothetical protein
LKRILIFCLFAVCLATAQKKQSIAVLPCIGDFDAKGLERLRNKVEELARDVLPANDFRLIPYKNVKEEIGEEELFNACKDGGTCFGDLAGKANADYGAWCMVNKSASEKLILSFQLYNVGEKDIIETKSYDTYNPKSVDDMLEIIKKEVPDAFRKIPGAGKSSPTQPIIPGGIDSVQTPDDYEFFYGKKHYVVNLTTEPEGAGLSFNGVRCETPCTVQLAEGNVRMIADLKQYENTDTIVSIKQNNQKINIKLKPNFGTLIINPAYSDGIGKNENWNLIINGETVYSLERDYKPTEYPQYLSSCVSTIRNNIEKF